MPENTHWLAHPSIWMTLLFVICLIIENRIVRRFLRGLADFPDTWRHAGEPVLGKQTNFINALPLLKYLWQRSYKQSDCEQGAAFCDQHRSAVISSYSAGFLSAIAVFVCVGFFGFPGAQ